MAMTIPSCVTGPGYGQGFKLKVALEFVKRLICSSESEYYFIKIQFILYHLANLYPFTDLDLYFMGRTPQIGTVTSEGCQTKVV